MAIDPEMQEFLGMFLTEGGENLSKLEASAAALKSRADDAEAAETARVASHTLKGMSNQLGFGTIGSLSRAVELLFSALRKTKQAPSPDMVASLADSVALLKVLMAQAATGDPSDPNLEALIKRIDGLTASCAQPQA